MITILPPVSDSPPSETKSSDTLAFKRKCKLVKQYQIDYQKEVNKEYEIGWTSEKYFDKSRIKIHVQPVSIYFLQCSKKFQNTFRNYFFVSKYFTISISSFLLNEFYSDGKQLC